MKARLKDVAREADVTLPTASMVLNNRTCLVAISAGTRQRVLDAARRLNYQPDHAARALRTRRTFTIGVITSSPRDQWRMLDMAESVAELKGFELVVTVSRWNAGAEEKTIRRLLNRSVDGILILGPAIETVRRTELEALAAVDFPVVGAGPVVIDGIDCVDYARAATMRELTAHLLEQGCRSFAFMHSVDTPGYRALQAGIESGIAGCPGAVFAPIRFGQAHATATMDQAADMAEKLLKNSADGMRRPNAIICRTDELAMAAVEGAKRAGLSVPRDLAVTGSGNTLAGKVFDPSLTTLKMPHEAMITEAMNHLIGRITNPGVKRERLAKMFPAEIIVRQSSLFKGTGN